jgi:hypothetical protein
MMILMLISAVLFLLWMIIEAYYRKGRGDREKEIMKETLEVEKKRNEIAKRPCYSASELLKRMRKTDSTK